MPLLIGQKMAEDRVKEQSMTYTVDYIPEDLPAGVSAYVVNGSKIPTFPKSEVLGVGYERWYNPITDEFFFEEVIRELTPAQKNEQRIADLELAIAYQLGGAN